MSELTKYIKTLEEKIFSNDKNHYITEKTLLDNILADNENLQRIIASRSASEETKAKALESFNRNEQLLREKMVKYGIEINQAINTNEDIANMVNMLNASLEETA